MSPETFINLISGTAGAITVLVIWLGLMVGGKLHSESEFQREVGARAELRKALAEMTAAKETADARADAAVRASELVAQSFTKARERRARP